jgi:hypothetical protein
MAWNEFTECLGGDFATLRDEAEQDLETMLQYLIDAWNSLDDRVKAVLITLFTWYGKDVVTKVIPAVAGSEAFWAAVAGVGLGVFIAMCVDCWPRLQEPAATEAAAQ